MRRYKNTASLFIFVFISMLLVTISYAEPASNYAPGNLVIQFTKQATQNSSFNINVSNRLVTSGLDRVDSLLSLYRAHSVENFYRHISPEEIGTYKERVYIFHLNPHIKIPNVIHRFDHLPSISNASPNWLYEVQETPNDTYFSQQWGLSKINAESAWDTSQGSSSVLIGILDTGVDLNHPDLQNKLVSSQYWRDEVDIDTDAYESAGYTLYPDEDYTTPDSDPQDVMGHGTHVAGIAGAETDNNTGVASIGWNCLIVPLRAGFKIKDSNGNERGLLENDDWANALDWARQNTSVDIINMSF